MLNTSIASFGLDISELSLKIAQLVDVDGGFCLQAWNNLTISKGVIQDGNIIDEDKILGSLEKLIENAAGRITTDYLSMCLPETKTFIKLMDVNYDGMQIINALEEEMTKHIPLPLNELLYDWQLLSDDTNAKRAKILVGAAPIVLVDSYIDIVKKIGLKPVALEIEAQSIVNSIYGFKQDSKGRTRFDLGNVLGNLRKKINKAEKVEEVNKANKKPREFTKKPIGPTLAKDGGKIIIDFGATRSSLILYDHNTIQFTSSLNISGEGITHRLAQALKLEEREAEKAKVICGLDPKKAKGKIYKVLGVCLDELIREVQKMVVFYGNHFEETSKIDEIILTGGGSNMVNLSDYLSQKLNIRVSKGLPLGDKLINNKQKPIPESQMLSFNTAIGLALRTLLLTE